MAYETSGYPYWVVVSLRFRPMLQKNIGRHTIKENTVASSGLGLICSRHATIEMVDTRSKWIAEGLTIIVSSFECLSV